MSYIMRYILRCAPINLILFLFLTPAQAQPDIGPVMPSLLSWLSDTSVKAHQFRDQLSHAKVSSVNAPVEDANSTTSQSSTSSIGQREPHQLQTYQLQPHQLQAPLPPENENAALDYLRLHKILLQDKPLDQSAFQSASDLAWGREITKKQGQEVRELLATRGDVLELIKSAASKERCVFQRDWNKGPALELAEYATIRQAATLLCAQQALLLRDGHPLEAVAYARAVYRLAGHAASDPLIISYLFGQVCEQMENRQLREILQRAGTQEKVVTAVRDVIVRFRPSYSVRQAVEGEFVMAQAQLELLRGASPKIWMAHLKLIAPGQMALFPGQREDQKQVENQGENQGENQDQNQQRPTTFTEAERRFLNAVLDAVQARWRQRLHHFLSNQNLAAIVTAPEVNAPEAHALPHAQLTTNTNLRQLNPVDFLDHNWKPSGPISERETVRQMQTAILLAACDVLLYKMQHGAFPVQLADAQTIAHTTALPTEGITLDYHRENIGFTIYSSVPARAIDDQHLMFRYR